MVLGENLAIPNFGKFLESLSKLFILKKTTCNLTYMKSEEQKLLHCIFEYPGRLFGLLFDTTAWGFVYLIFILFSLIYCTCTLYLNI
jgi:hypothetical protein